MKIIDTSRFMNYKAYENKKIIFKKCNHIGIYLKNKKRKK